MKKVRTSFDGLEFEHNKRKNAVSSLNPFKITASNIEKLINAGINVDIRFTLDLDNSSDLLKLAKFLCDKYEGNPLVKMYTRCIFQETTSSAATNNFKKVALTCYFLNYAHIFIISSLSLALQDCFTRYKYFYSCSPVTSTSFNMLR